MLEMKTGEEIPEVENPGMDEPWPITRAPVTTSKSRTPGQTDWL